MLILLAIGGCLHSGAATSEGYNCPDHGDEYELQVITSHLAVWGPRPVLWPITRTYGPKEVRFDATAEPTPCFEAETDMARRRGHERALWLAMPDARGRQGPPAAGKIQVSVQPSRVGFDRTCTYAWITTREEKEGRSDDQPPRWEACLRREDSGEWIAVYEERYP